jgi:hypothetical protein
MMASHLSDGCHKAGERVNCSMEVYLSVDFGKVWKPVTSYVAQFDWGPAVDGVLKAGMQKESMFLVTYEKKEGAYSPHFTPVARSRTQHTPPHASIYTSHAPPTRRLRATRCLATANS